MGERWLEAAAWWVEGREAGKGRRRGPRAGWEPREAAKGGAGRGSKRAAAAGRWGQRIERRAGCRRRTEAVGKPRASGARADAKGWSGGKSSREGGCW